MASVPRVWDSIMGSVYRNIKAQSSLKQALFNIIADDVIFAITKHEELVDPSLSLDALIWRLFHEESEVRVQPSVRLSRGCRCSIDHYREVLARFPEEDRVDMRDEAGNIVVDCAFCSRLFTIDA